MGRWGAISTTVSTSQRPLTTAPRPAVRAERVSAASVSRDQRFEPSSIPAPVCRAGSGAIPPGLLDEHRPHLGGRDAAGGVDDADDGPGDGLQAVLLDLVEGVLLVEQVPGGGEEVDDGDAGRRVEGPVGG